MEGLISIPKQYLPILSNYYNLKVTKSLEIYHYLKGWAEMNQWVIPGIPGDQVERVSRIVDAALQAADPRAAVVRALGRCGEWQEASGNILDLNSGRRVRVMGVGKAALAMAQGLIDCLGDRISDGILITKHTSPQPALPECFRVLPGGHPVPTQDSVNSTQALIEFLREGQAGDIVFCLISGGGSALMTFPHPGVTLADLQELTRLLLACGANITEMNTLRKHLDQVKGGGLARLASPARVVTLILSDVVGSPLDVIASGPTVADPTSYADAIAVIHKYQLMDRVPAAIRQTLQQGLAGKLPETVKPGDPVLSQVTNCLIASNAQAAQAAMEQAQREGFHALLLTTFLQGEAAQAGGFLAGILRQAATTGQPAPRPACLIAGGETTVTVRGQGLGGRNQELAMGAAALLDGLEQVALLTLATDGEDGPTDAAGAVVTGNTLAQARSLGLDSAAFLQNNDAYHFFSALGGLLKTGPTGTNVNDLAFLFTFQAPR